MGRFLFIDRETWYLGGGRDIFWTSGVFCFLGDLGFCSEGAVAASFGLMSARGCLDGRTGLGSGGCALSPSVRDSAAARSAARWACWGVDGC